MHNKPVASVTGANKGKGLQIAKNLVKHGFTVGLPWYGWHGFRRAAQSNLFRLGADDKVVQRVLRHAKPHVARERYIKVFEPALLAAMQKMQTTLGGLRSGQ